MSGKELLTAERVEGEKSSNQFTETAFTTFEPQPYDSSSDGDQKAAHEYNESCCGSLRVRVGSLHILLKKSELP